MCVRISLEYILTSNLTCFIVKGGLKAVVWTDVIQTGIMVGAMIIVIVKGTADVGGLSVVIERNSAGGRFEGPEYASEAQLLVLYCMLTAVPSVQFQSRSYGAQHLLDAADRWYLLLDVDELDQPEHDAALPVATFARICP